MEQVEAQPASSQSAENARYSRNIQALLLAVGMLFTGTMNTIFLKYQDKRSFSCNEETYECVKCEEGMENCTPFHQPVYQTFVMFVGETMCFLAFYIIRFFKTYAAAKKGEKIRDTSTLTGVRQFLLWIPTMCDLSATTLMNLGLILTYASVFQMLRGAVVVFTGVMSVIFLKRKQYAFHWLGMFFVVSGVTIVGLASTLEPGDEADAENPSLGAILIICAQVFTATQFVVEEKILGKYDAPPMLAIGLEGVFGVATLAVLMPILQATAGASGEFGFYFDVKFAFTLFISSPAILISSLGCVLSISFFNFFGLSITKVMSATSRSTIDALRTLLVWGFSLIVKWEDFIWLQVIGFVVLVFGTFTYNEVIRLPKFYYPPIATSSAPVTPEDDDENKPLLDKSVNNGDLA